MLLYQRQLLNRDCGSLGLSRDVLPVFPRVGSTHVPEQLGSWWVREELVAIVADHQEILTPVLQPRSADAIDLLEVVDLREVWVADVGICLQAFPTHLALRTPFREDYLTDYPPGGVCEGPLGAAGTLEASTVEGAVVLELRSAMPAVTWPWVALLAVVAEGTSLNKL